MPLLYITVLFSSTVRPVKLVQNVKKQQLFATVCLHKSPFIMALFPLLPFLSRSQRGNCKHPWNRNSNCRRETALVKRVVFFFLQYIYYMSFLTTQSHILLMQKLFPIPTSDNQDICFGTPK